MCVLLCVFGAPRACAWWMGMGQIVGVRDDIQRLQASNLAVEAGVALARWDVCLCFFMWGVFFVLCAF